MRNSLRSVELFHDLHGGKETLFKQRGVRIVRAVALGVIVFGKGFHCRDARRFQPCRGKSRRVRGTEARAAFRTFRARLFCGDEK